MKRLKLTQGKYTLIDDENFEELSKVSWCITKTGEDRWYAINKSHGINTYMHRFLMKTPKGMDTDHINGDSLDNRKENLRICTRSENLYNSRIPKRNVDNPDSVNIPFPARKKAGKIFSH